MRLATKDYKKHAAKNSSCEKINEKLEKVTFSSTRDYKDFLGKKNVAKKEKWQIISKRTRKLSLSEPIKGIFSKKPTFI